MASQAGAPLAELLGEALAAPDGSAVPTASLPARGVALVGLYFGSCCPTSSSSSAAAALGNSSPAAAAAGPCASFAASLAAFYGRFQADARPGRLEIVFVAAEQDPPRWQEATRTMPWLALPCTDKRRKAAQWIPDASAAFWVEIAGSERRLHD